MTPARMAATRLDRLDADEHSDHGDAADADCESNDGAAIRNP